MGGTIGKLGSECGAIVADESYDDGVRITLERPSGLAPLAITCGISGLFAHTRFFESEAEARLQYGAMKLALARMMEAIRSLDNSQPSDALLIARLCQTFVEEFP